MQKKKGHFWPKSRLFLCENLQRKAIDGKTSHCYNIFSEEVLFMKKYGKIFSLFLAMILIFCFTGCKKEEAAPAPTVMDHINAGEYEKAYDLLLALENPTEEEKALLNKFYFLEQENSGDNGYRLICTYDEKGNLLTRDETAPNGTWTKVSNTYDEKGRLLTETTTSQSGTSDTPREQTYTYTYDETGNVLTKDYTVKGGKWEKTVYTYDGKGNKLTESFSDSKDAWKKDVFTYDDKGNLLSRDRTDSYKLHSIYTYTYDEDGNQLVFRKASGKNWEQLDSTYDEKGNIIFERRTSSAGEDISVAYIYDENNNLLTKDSDSYTCVYTYDDKGNLLTENQVNANGASHKITCTYDESGNLLTEENILTSESYREYYTYTYTYDESGRQLSQLWANDKDEWTKTERTFDEKGNKLTETVTTHKETERDERFVYDSYGNLIQRELIYRNNPKVTYTSRWKLYYDPDR